MPDLQDELMRRAHAKVAAEMPDVKPVSVTPPSILDSVFMPRDVNAITNPFTGNITYDPAMVSNPEQTMAHELTHSRQAQHETLLEKLVGLRGDPAVPKTTAQNPSFQNPYYWRPQEMEAFQAERDRATRLKTPNYVDPVLGTTDINLPAGK